MVRVERAPERCFLPPLQAASEEAALGTFARELNLKLDFAEEGETRRVRPDQHLHLERIVGGHFLLSEEPAPSLSNVHLNATSDPLNGRRQGHVKVRVRWGSRARQLRDANVGLPRPRPP